MTTTPPPKPTPTRPLAPPTDAFSASSVARSTRFPRTPWAARLKVYGATPQAVRAELDAEYDRITDQLDALIAAGAEG